MDAERSTHMRFDRIARPMTALLVLAVATGLAYRPGALLLNGGALRPSLRIVNAGTSGNRASCPKGYTACISVLPFTTQYCVSTNGNCTSGVAPGTWIWSAHVGRVKGQYFKELQATWSPNPGNPSTVTITTRQQVRKSHTKVVAYVALSVCEASSGGCYDDFAVYGILE
jgi:hypothetical protein